MGTIANANSMDEDCVTYETRTHPLPQLDARFVLRRASCEHSNESHQISSLDVSRGWWILEASDARMLVKGMGSIGVD